MKAINFFIIDTKSVRGKKKKFVFRLKSNGLLILSTLLASR
jgi:hypothetical protein